MQNITITLDPETANWVRVKAAEQNTSVSRFVGEILQGKMRHRIEYERAMRQWMSRSPLPLLRNPGEQLPTRDEIHDRSRFR